MNKESDSSAKNLTNFSKNPTFKLNDDLKVFKKPTFVTKNTRNLTEFEENRTKKTQKSDKNAMISSATRFFFSPRGKLRDFREKLASFRRQSAITVAKFANFRRFQGVFRGFRGKNREIRQFSGLFAGFLGNCAGSYVYFSINLNENASFSSFSQVLLEFFVIFREIIGSAMKILGICRENARKVRILVEFLNISVNCLFFSTIFVSYEEIYCEIINFLRIYRVFKLFRDLNQLKSRIFARKTSDFGKKTEFFRFFCDYFLIVLAFSNVFRIIFRENREKYGFFAILDIFLGFSRLTTVKTLDFDAKVAENSIFLAFFMVNLVILMSFFQNLWKSAKSCQISYHNANFYAILLVFCGESTSFKRIFSKFLKKTENFCRKPRVFVRKNGKFHEFRVKSQDFVEISEETMEDQANLSKNLYIWLETSVFPEGTRDFSDFLKISSKFPEKTRILLENPLNFSKFMPFPKENCVFLEETRFQLIKLAIFQPIFLDFLDFFSDSHENLSKSAQIPVKVAKARVSPVISQLKFADFAKIAFFASFSKFCSPICCFSLRKSEKNAKNTDFLEENDEILFFCEKIAESQHFIENFSMQELIIYRNLENSMKNSRISAGNLDNCLNFAENTSFLPIPPDFSQKSELFSGNSRKKIRKSPVFVDLFSLNQGKLEKFVKIREFFKNHAVIFVESLEKLVKLVQILTISPRNLNNFAENAENPNVFVFFSEEIGESVLKSQEIQRKTAFSWVFLRGDWNNPKHLAFVKPEDSKLLMILLSNRENPGNFAKTRLLSAFFQRNYKKMRVLWETETGISTNFTVFKDFSVLSAIFLEKQAISHDFWHDFADFALFSLKITEKELKTYKDYRSFWYNLLNSRENEEDFVDIFPLFVKKAEVPLENQRSSPYILCKLDENLSLDDELLAFFRKKQGVSKKTRENCEISKESQGVLSETLIFQQKIEEKVKDFSEKPERTLSFSNFKGKIKNQLIFRDSLIKALGFQVKVFREIF